MNAYKTFLMLFAVLLLAAATYRWASFFDIQIFKPRQSYIEYVEQHGAAMIENVHEDGTVEGYWAEDDGSLRKVLFRDGLLSYEKSFTKQELWQRQSTVKRFNIPKSQENEVMLGDPSIDRLKKQTRPGK